MKENYPIEDHYEKEAMNIFSECEKEVSGDDGLLEKARYEKDGEVNWLTEAGLKIAFASNFFALYQTYSILSKLLDDKIIKPNIEVCILASGWGPLAYGLKKKLFQHSKICCLDANHGLTELGEKIFSLGKVSGVEFIPAQAEKLPRKLHNKFAIVISPHFLHSGYRTLRGKEEKIVQEVAKILKDDGLLFISNCMASPPQFSGFRILYVTHSPPCSHYVLRKG